MRRKINVQLVSISIIAIISTMLVMLFVFYDLFQTQVQDDLRANAIVLKNTEFFIQGMKMHYIWITGSFELHGYPQQERFFMIMMQM